MKVIGYVRVSSDKQAEEGVSLEAQEAKLRQYAELYDLELTEVVVDAGASAKNLNRDGLQRALVALDEGRAEGLLIAKLDRLTRSVKDLGSLLDSYFSAKFSLISVADQINTSTAAGRLVLNVLTSVAQWEREAIGERTSAALQHKIANGEHVGSPGLGYEMNGGELVPVVEEMKAVAEMKRLRGEGATLQQIAEHLTAQGVRTKRGGQWYPATVAKVLKRAAA